ncbi:unnamed protein product [Toxocara canis]|uniref:Uncharacterized protein n=1 Tax=Toxocara canis TaxID=6265 RepID=A0A183UHY0_TOXCA|nr:unnamed protein product [Toxocara canis]
MWGGPVVVIINGGSDGVSGVSGVHEVSVQERGNGMHSKSLDIGDNAERERDLFAELESAPHLDGGHFSSTEGRTPHSPTAYAAC